MSKFKTNGMEWNKPAYPYTELVYISRFVKQNIKVNIGARKKESCPFINGKRGRFIFMLL